MLLYSEAMLYLRMLRSSTVGSYIYVYEYSYSVALFEGSHIFVRMMAIFGEKRDMLLSLSYFSPNIAIIAWLSCTCLQVYFHSLFEMLSEIAVMTG